MKNDGISAIAFHRFISQPASGRSSALPLLAAFLVLSLILGKLHLHSLFFRPDNSFSEADLVNSISTSDAEISKINTSISHNEIKIQSIAKAESYKKILDDKILLRDTYDKIISICRELPAIIFTKVIAPLETVAKETLSVLHPDWNLIFEVSGNVIVEKDVNNASIAIDSASLSRGESLLVNYILKVVYAKLIGVNYIIIDDADSLDEHHLKSLLECISKSSIPTLLLSANKITASYELKEIKI